MAKCRYCGSSVSAGGSCSRSPYPRLPSDVVRTLAADRSIEVRCHLAANPKLVATLSEAAIRRNWLGSRQPRIRMALASNEALSAANLDLLARDGRPEVRAMCARNPSASPDTRARLLSDEVDVRLALASNPSLTTDEAASLVMGDSLAVAATVLGQRKFADSKTNSALPTDPAGAMLRWLARERWDARRFTDVFDGPNRPDHSGVFIDFIHALVWSGGRTFDAEKSPDWIVRSIIAMNAPRQSEVLAVLKSDDNPIVRAAAMS
jgi:hypothetical protein